MSEGKQSAFWRSGYDLLWAARADFAAKLIEAGETDPQRVIASMERWEMHYSPGTDGVRWQWDKNAGNESGQLPSGVPASRDSVFNGQRLVVSAYTFANLTYFLADLFDASGPFDAVIELGCGFGRNLFRLRAAGLPRGVRYFGGELSESALALGRRLAALDASLSIAFFRFDHLAPDLAPLGSIERALVFTCHSLEQVTEIPQSFFAAIAGCARRVTCAHLEPFGFQVRAMTVPQQDQRRFIEERGWNRNLHAAAEQAERAGIIKRTFLAPDVFLSTDAVSPTSLLVWTDARG